MALLVATSLAAAELPRGKVIDVVTAEGNAEQSYALFLPSSYTPQHSWPILYCLDPGARGRIPVERFAQAAEKAGFIVAGSNTCRNGPVEPEREAIRWLLQDTHARLAIDDARVYVTGMSGGARVALAWAQNGSIAGVIACAAGFGQQVPQQIPFRLYATAAVDDFNHDELFENSLEFARRGIAHRFVEFDGDHDWLPESLTTEALDYMQGKVPPQAAQPSKRQQKIARMFENRQRDVMSAAAPEKREILGDLRKAAAKPDDSDERRVARRVVMGTFVSMVEQARGLVEQKDYADAIPCWEVALMARPGEPGVWYSLAVARAATGDKHGALDALDHAADSGFRDRERVEKEPLLDKARADKRYQAFLEKLK
ncbi:MAG TPA: hypothetical protein VMJ34_07645 [Bryobacteraceae bacterium]|nr:hypothetical protein [Bryobacteraceae bacterium]